MRTSKQCEVAGCERWSKGKGKCAVHLRRQRLGQALDAPIRNWVPCKLDNPCLVEGCSIRSVNKGLCPKHSYRLKKGLDLNTDDFVKKYIPAPDDGICEIFGCDKPSVCKRMCAGHLSRQKTGANVNVKLRKISPSGEGSINKQGYRVIQKPDHANSWKDGSILEHRWIMSEHIGRPLSRTELVHHKNGDRQDNRIDNLELCDNSQPPGQRVCDKISWMKEFLYIYGFDVVERNYPGWIS